MRRFTFLFIVLPIAVVLVILSVANREPVTLSLDPIGTPAPAWSLTVPLFALLFVTLALGVLIGGMATWFGQGKWRKAARSERDSAMQLRRELEQSRRPPPPEVTPLPGPPGGLI